MSELKISFVDIIRCTRKSDVEKLCKSAIITDWEFADFILACKLGLTHLNHEMHFFDFVPADVEMRRGDRQILHASPASKEGQKAARRLFKTHGLRKHKVGHMFFSKEPSHPLREWHFVYFDMSETCAKHTHWEGGPHIHFINHLWNLDCQGIWGDFLLNANFPSGTPHLRYIRNPKE